MWDGLFSLLSFSVVMGLASFLTGCLPLSFALSQNHSRIVSALGTGLLVGACLIIIIPEGIETLYSAQKGIHHDHTTNNDFSTGGGATAEQEGESAEPHAYVGLALIVGFILMFLIDELPRHLPLQFSRKQPLHISLANLSQGPHHESTDRISDEESGGFWSQFTLRKSSTTIGLVIHATADGIALAASSFMTQTSTGLIVFLALMIHKAPAAFGLTSVLLKQGLTKREAKAHLLIFSLAAPVGAIGTWTMVNLLVGGQIQSEESMNFATGILLLFSGGTFLYVAMHTMQEIESESTDESAEGYGNGHGYNANAPGQPKSKHRDLSSTLLAVVGMLLPLLAQIGHAH